MESQTHLYRITYREWLAGVRLARRRNVMWLLRYLASWLIPLLFAYIAVAGLWEAAHGAAKWSDVGNGALVCAAVVAGLVGWRVWRMRRIFSRSVAARHPEGIALAFNDEYFVSGLPGRSEGRFLWPAIYDFAENGQVALVYTSPKAFIVIPRHAMPVESWAIFKELFHFRKTARDAD